ncbi:type II secretion system protein GspM [Luteimonas sp. 50]|uniref:Type II secretion system protein GspM n=1 Tax=Cognatiluteimonas sedimenti TaxID=2927791 RepID=A0ABT0A3U9_9GAMM|nr:type II secretion system protein GspM [Lysobacter sedimenti]MCJ0825660.1 type II secretion system protein GspM [Lysobacter sedimenti]
MPATTDRDRWLALGLLLAALALAYLLLVHPWWTVPMQETGARIATLQQRELRARMQLQQAPDIGRRLAVAQQQDAAAPAFLPEATTELATAGLVQRLETVVAQASPGNRGCAISNRSPMDGNGGQTERFARVTVQVRLRCGNAELAAVLHALESGSPRLFVDNLNVLAQRYFFLPGQNRAQDAGLDVSFDLYGYLRPRPGQAVVEVPRAR